MVGGSNPSGVTIRRGITILRLAIFLLAIIGTSAYAWFWVGEEKKEKKRDKLEKADIICPICGYINEYKKWDLVLYDCRLRENAISCHYCSANISRQFNEIFFVKKYKEERKKQLEYINMAKEYNDALQQIQGEKNESAFRICPIIAYYCYYSYVVYI